MKKQQIFNKKNINNNNLEESKVNFIEVLDSYYISKYNINKIEKNTKIEEDKKIVNITFIPGFIGY